MSREIKFRAWDKGLGEMLNLLALRDDTGNILMQRFSQPKTVVRSKPEDVEVMQFTGLLDKNGKEIYEGDIVRYDKNSKGYGARWSDPVTIIWNDYSACFDFKDSYNGLIYKSYEVFGNIYESPQIKIGEK